MHGTYQNLITARNITVCIPSKKEKSKYIQPHRVSIVPPQLQLFKPKNAVNSLGWHHSTIITTTFHVSDNIHISKQRPVILFIPYKI